MLCSYGIGHADQTPPIYASRHHDTPVELEPADHEEPESLDSRAARLELLAPTPEPVAGEDDDEELESAELEDDDLDLDGEEAAA